MTYHYTYCSYEESGRSYIGSRTCRCNPENDIRYFGSFTDKTFAPTKKVILKLYNTAEECLLAEHLMMRLFNVAYEEHFANKQFSPYTNFGCPLVHSKFMKNNKHRVGKHHSEESKKKTSETMKAKPKGENHPHHGRVLTEEHKRKLSDSKRGQKRTPEQRKRISEGVSKACARRKQLNNKKAE